MYKDGEGNIISKIHYIYEQAFTWFSVREVTLFNVENEAILALKWLTIDLKKKRKHSPIYNREYKA